MKKILTLIVLLFVFVSCTSDKDYEQRNYCKNSTIVVLKKDFFGGGRTSRVYKLYVFNGSEALWYETNEETYSKYKVNDTLPTLVLMTINTFRK